MARAIQVQPVSSFDPDAYTAETGERTCFGCGALEHKPGQFKGGMCLPCTTQIDKASKKEQVMTTETVEDQPDQTSTQEMPAPEKSKSRRRRVAKAVNEALGVPAKKPTKAGTKAAKKPASSAPSAPVFRGQTVQLTPTEIEAKIAEAASQDPEGARRSVTCTVQIGSERVAPKWAMTVLTGVPVSQFATPDAEKFLTRVGYTVERTEKPAKQESTSPAHDVGSMVPATA